MACAWTASKGYDKIKKEMDVAFALNDDPHWIKLHGSRNLASVRDGPSHHTLLGLKIDKGSQSSDTRFLLCRRILVKERKREIRLF
jgi:hypothetical protein